MTSKSSPCPFCGERLKVTYAANNQTVNGFAHVMDYDNPCIMGGRHIGKGIINRWNRRTSANVLYMEVIDNAPFFNNEGKGREVSTLMINETIEYYKTSRQTGE